MASQCIGQANFLTVHANKIIATGILLSVMTLVLGILANQKVDFFASVPQANCFILGGSIPIGLILIALLIKKCANTEGTPLKKGMTLVQLPIPIAKHVVGFLPGEDLGQLIKICKYANKTFDNEDLWKNVALRLDMVLPVIENPKKRVIEHYRDALSVQCHILGAIGIPLSNDRFEEMQAAVTIINTNRAVFQRLADTSKTKLRFHPGNPGFIRLLVDCKIKIPLNWLLDAVCTVPVQFKVVSLMFQLNGFGNRIEMSKAADCILEGSWDRDVEPDEDLLAIARPYRLSQKEWESEVVKRDG